MSKWLLLLAVIAGFFWWLRQRALRSGRKNSTASTPPASSDSAMSGAPQAMVACAHCGLHLPRADALLDAEPAGPTPLSTRSAERWYCTADHRAAARASGR